MNVEPFRPKICCLMSRFQCGGAERVMTWMANYWAAKGWPVHLLTLGGERSPFYPLHPAVRYETLHLEIRDNTKPTTWWKSVIRLPIGLRAAIDRLRPEVIISFLTEANVLAVMATLGRHVPIIASERKNPRISNQSFRWELLSKLLYPYASCVVPQTHRAMECFSRRVRLRARVIPNPVSVPPEGGTTMDLNKKGKKVLLAIGRLVANKGFDMLISAFGGIAHRHRDWRLVIYGEGPERASLESLVERLELAHQVSLPGITREPYERMRGADLFVLSSRSEGFPNVLCEAMACGMPVISFDCPYGPSEIVRNGFDGVLVPAEDVSKLSTTIDQLMVDDAQRRRLAANAKTIVDRFGTERVMAMWEELLRDVLSDYHANG